MNGQSPLLGHPSSLTAASSRDVTEILDIENQDIKQLREQILQDTSTSEKLQDLPLLREKIKHAKDTISSLSDAERDSAIKSISIMTTTLQNTEELKHQLEKKEQKFLSWKPFLTDAKTVCLQLGITKMTLPELIDFRDFCISCGKRALFEEACAMGFLGGGQKNYSVTLAKLFLDKAIIDPNLNKTGWPHASAKAWLSRGLRNILNDNPKELSLETKEIVKGWIHSFEQAIWWSFKSDKDIKDLVEQINQLQNLPPDNCVIVSANTKDHATLLLVKKEPSGNFIVVHYNTGKGIEKHEKLGECHQTFREFRDIPLEDLQNLETWKNIFQCEKTTSNVDDLYKAMEALIQHGKRKGYPPDPILYSKGQYRGTCTVLSCLAMMKHQILTRNEKWEENKVEYQLLKAFLRIKLWQELYHYPGYQATTKLASSKIEKAGATLGLWEIACNEEQYLKALQDFQSFQIPAPKDIPKNSKERFLALQEMSNQLANRWIQEKSLILTTPPSLTLAFRAYMDANMNLQALEESFNALLDQIKTKKREELANDFAFCIKEGKYFLSKFPIFRERVVLDFFQRLPPSYVNTCFQQMAINWPSVALYLVKNVRNEDLSKRIIQSLIRAKTKEALAAIKEIALFSDRNTKEFIYSHLVEKFPGSANDWIKELALQNEWEEGMNLAIHFAKKKPERTLELIHKALENSEEQSFVFATILIAGFVPSNITESFELFWHCIKLDSEPSKKCAFLILDRLSKTNPENAIRFTKACIDSKNTTVTNFIPNLCESLARYYPAKAKEFVLELLSYNTDETNQYAIWIVKALAGSPQLLELALDLQKIESPVKFEILKLIQSVQLSKSRKRKQENEEKDTSKEQKVA